LPVRFARLRIAGFKSFAEPATVEIRSGLTGIVGPNGCGKSNVVEALRWAMGEASARSLRGGEMEDVIFAGTAGRSSRNVAEVALTLEEAAGTAPPPFHDQPELEIVRRIERGAGSAFRVNGQELRARDVQTLFADLASGARTSGMVSQGRIGALIESRPQERRSLLEEAAGITGLHARRHEAELKLRAAESNLARAEDRRGQLEAQLAGLKRQARQASRYRNISGAIRQAEAELLAIQRARAEAGRAEAQAALEAARQAAATAAEEATAASERAAERQAALPSLREAEAEARTALERHRVTQEQIAAEEERARTALADAERRLAQLRADLEHAQELSRDALAADARLGEEDAALSQTSLAFPAKIEANERLTAETADAARLAEAEANRATEAAAEVAARAQAAAQELAAAEARARRLAEQHARVCDERDRMRLQVVDPVRLDEAATAQARAEAALTEARGALDAAEQARAVAVAALAEARTRHTDAEAQRARLDAEMRALSEILAVKDGEQWPPMVDALDVPAGLEPALGAVLGEELSSAADPAAARHWRELPPLDPPLALPEGVTCLAGIVQAPAALGRALSQIGLADDEAAGDAAQKLLAPGQAVVSPAGAVWRWDGYTIRAGTPTPAAVRLQQRNRVLVLRTALVEAEAQAAETGRALGAAEAAERDAIAAERELRAARAEAERHCDVARAAAVQLRAQAEAAASRLAAVESQLARIEPDRAEAEAAVVASRAAQAELPDLGVLREAVEQARAALAEARSREAAARAERDALSQEQLVCGARREAIGAERAGWRDRAEDAALRLGELTERQREAEAEHAGLAAAPAQAAARRQAALTALEAAHATHGQAARALAQAVAEAGEADRVSRSANERAAGAREDAVRAEGAEAQADQAWAGVCERIAERLGAGAVLPEPPADLGAEPEDKARRRFERLQRERDEMGPVNLRAEAEAGEVEGQLTALDREREEIGSAIAKLRGSIGHLNREGRERLTAVFEQVDRNFQALFSRMFGGGRANLALVGSDDPLEAGLEIYAQPPGKKLSTLSLLSGGEQALVALSLIFAVFRCNPAPVSVLDEVDAPLDDANVDRFCTLLDDMVRETETRFLVVTHHPLTMARMDQLYGVTMQERGVSRLLSVDLAAAEEMAEPERMAAE